MTLQTKTKKAIGFSLLALAIVLVLYSFTPVGAFLPSTNPDGKDVLCQVTFNVNGITGQTCQTNGACRTGSFLPFSLLDWSNSPSTISMLVGSRTYASSQYTTTNTVGLLPNSMTQPLEACVPGATQTVTLTLKNSANQVLTSNTVNVQ